MTHRTFDDPNSIEAKQALLDNHCEKTHRKNHRVRRRSKQLKQIATIKLKHSIGVQKKARIKFLAKARAFWSGKTDEHPKENKNVVGDKKS